MIYVLSHKIFKTLLSIFFIYPGSLLWASTPWPDVPTPPQSSVAWVAKDVWINGIASRILNLKSQLPVEAVAAYYRAHWESGYAASSRTEKINDWTTVSTLHGPYSLLLQIKPNKKSGSEGLLSVINIAEKKSSSLPTDLPMSNYIHVKQVLESVDGAVRSFYIAAISSKSYEYVQRNITVVWTQRGWSLHSEHKHPYGILRRYQHDGKAMDVVLLQQPGERSVHLHINMTQAAWPEE